MAATPHILIDFVYTSDCVDFKFNMCLRKDRANMEFIDAHTHIRTCAHHTTWPLSELPQLSGAFFLHPSIPPSSHLLPIESLCVQTYSAGGMLNLFPAAQHKETQTHMHFFKLGFN